MPDRAQGGPEAPRRPARADREGATQVVAAHLILLPYSLRPICYLEQLQAPAQEV